MYGDDLQQFLTSFAAERLAILQRHEASARLVSHYDFNNAYQYVINRGEAHVQWLQNALAEFEAVYPPPADGVAQPEPPTGRKDTAATFQRIMRDEASILDAFVARWRPRVAEMTHARHRKMLNVILGEALEHARLFAQGSGGTEALIGTHRSDALRVGYVLPTRWVE